ncbi:MAG: DegT/DnrJ/EryC1/StrS family aminotransferase, partial [Anaerolineales bacterium]|nr:DegT/DnrJ/EryC1/StrS family aminotransferase [Anaerolineales bacterium]
KAIMPVHLYGYMADMDAIQAIADKHNLAIIEDAAQAVGATYKGKVAGGIGTGCFSLYATKNVMSVEGGMITTNDDDVAEKARLLRSHGMKRRYYYDMLGFNFRMSDLHAAIGLTQMGRLADFNAKRKANAEYLQARLESVKVP